MSLIDRLLPSWRAVAVIVPIVIIGLVVTLLLTSSLAPYQPFTLRSYRVTPDVVCTNGEVTALVTRRFNTEFDYLQLKESWVARDVLGVEQGRPVETVQGELPQEVLQPTDGFETVPSPLLNSAPDKPGTYQVRIVTEFHGDRWNIMPAIGSATFTSNRVRVVPCEEEESG